MTRPHAPRHAAPPGTASPPPPGSLAALVFRALYTDYDLHIVAGVHVAVPKGTPCFAGPSLGEIARQISAAAAPARPPARPPGQEEASP